MQVILTFAFYAAIVFKLCRTTAKKSRERERQLGVGVGVGVGKQQCERVNGNGNGYDDSPSAATTPVVVSTLNSDCVGVLQLTKTINASYSKSFRMVSLVILAFLLANLPWHVVENLRVTSRIVIKASDSTYIATWILTYMNGLLNPPLYFFMNRYYRKAAVRFVMCKSVRSEAWREHQRRHTIYQLELKRQNAAPSDRRSSRVFLDLHHDRSSSHQLHKNCTEFVI